MGVGEATTDVVVFVSSMPVVFMAFFTWFIVLLFCSYFVISGFVLAAEFPEVLCCPV